MRRRDVLDIALVLGVWAVAIAFIQPHGEFPILDDWDFTIATWNFARTGHFHFTPFTAVSLRAMVVWGAAWTRLFGESFLVLRLSTLTLAALTIVIVHEILRRAGLSRLPRLVATLAFAFHPLFLWSSCTYMTEVPFVCLSAAAFLLIWRGLEDEKSLLVAAGCAVAMVSCFVRQTGIINIVAPLVVAALFPGKRRFTPIFVALAAMFAAIFFLKPEWLAGSPTEFASHYKVWHEVSFRLPQQIALAYHYVVFNAQDSALFFLPLVVPLVLLLRKRSKSELALLVAVAVVLLWRVQHLVNIGIAMPYFAFASQEDILQGNVLIDFGLGPPTVIDVWSMQHPYPFHLAEAGKLIVTYVSVAAAALLLWSVVLSLKRRNLLLILSVALAATGTAALIGSGFYSDRYSLDASWSIGIALALIVPWQERWARILAILTLAAVAVFSILSVQEYFSWNRARWAAFQSLRTRGVQVTQIDGGSEPTNWYEISTMNRDEARKRTMFRPARQYTLTFAPLPGYVVVARFPFEGWLGFHRGAIHVLKAR
jgi:hypothetical protein